MRLFWIKNGDFVRKKTKHSLEIHKMIFFYVREDKTIDQQAKRRVATETATSMSEFHYNDQPRFT